MVTEERGGGKEDEVKGNFLLMKDSGVIVNDTWMLE